MAPRWLAFQVAGMCNQSWDFWISLQFPNFLTCNKLLLPSTSITSVCHLPQNGALPSEIPSSHPSSLKDTQSFTSSSEPTSFKKTPLIFHRAQLCIFLQLHGCIICRPHNPPIISDNDFSEFSEFQLLNYHNVVLECSPHPQVWWQPIPPTSPGLGYHQSSFSPYN